jgi:hypothetical protein
MDIPGRKRAGAAALVGAMVIGSAIALPARAQQRTPVAYGVPAAATRYLQQHTIDVGDVSVHQVRLFEIRTDFRDIGLEFNGVKVRESFTRGLTDYSEFTGPANSYVVFMLEDGNRVFARDTSVSHAPSTSGGGRDIHFWTATQITGGTGPFRTLRGQLRSAGSRVPGATSLTVEVSGEYWNEP